MEPIRTAKTNRNVNLHQNVFIGSALGKAPARLKDVLYDAFKTTFSSQDLTSLKVSEKIRPRQACR